MLRPVVSQSKMYEGTSNKSLRMSNYLIRISIVLFMLLFFYLAFLLIGIDFNLVLMKLQSMLLVRSFRVLLSRLVGWEVPFLVLVFFVGLGLDSSLHMMMAPAGGGDGSGAGSSQRPVHLDLNLPPGGRDELSAVIDDLAEAERKIQRAETEIQQIQEALQEIEGLNESRVEGLQANLGAIERELARLRTCLSEVDERVEQARSMDSARDQERARQQAELRAQMDPFIQTEARLAARRQALAEAVNSLQQQLRAQDQFLQEAGEGSTSAPVLKGGTPPFQPK